MVKCEPMKVIRVPWIRCRADEVGACSIDVHWQKRSFRLVANSEREAEEWWGGLKDAERNELAGLEESVESDQANLF